MHAFGIPIPRQLGKRRFVIQIRSFDGFEAKRRNFDKTFGRNGCTSQIRSFSSRIGPLLFPRSESRLLRDVLFVMVSQRFTQLSNVYLVEAEPTSEENQTISKCGRGAGSCFLGGAVFEIL